MSARFPRLLKETYKAQMKKRSKFRGVYHKRDCRDSLYRQSTKQCHMFDIGAAESYKLHTSTAMVSLTLGPRTKRIP